MQGRLRFSVLRCGIMSVLAGTLFILAGCRHYSTRNTSPSDYEPPKDSSEATARKVLLRGAGSGLTPEARKVEQSLGYQ